MITGGKILHITNWYPNPLDTIEAQFIKDQIDALHDFIPCDVVMLQIRKGSFKILKHSPSPREMIYIFQLPIRSWFVIEILSSILLFLFLLIKYDRKKYSAVNFHIAYPLLTYFNLFNKLIRVPIVISEHWSAYHFNFGVKKELHRVKRIFKHQANLITVSRSLADDVEKFSGCDHLKTFLLPNTVNDQLFCVKPPGTHTELNFFMLGCWQYPKIPWIILEALQIVKEKNFKFKTRIGGYGPYEDRLKEMILNLNLQDCVEYVGKQTFEQSAYEMQNSTHFLHASEYETFSLVCAEALCCGTPVVASAVGGIPDFVTGQNGRLVHENTVDHWVQALTDLYELKFNADEIADQAVQKFSGAKVGEQYFNIIKQIVRD